MQNFVDLALNHSQDLLTIEEFVKVTNYPIDQLFVDKFWHSLGSDEERLIYVDDELIKWLGYDAATLRDRKLSFERIFERSGIDIKKFNNEDYSKFLESYKNDNDHVEWPRGHSIYPPPSEGRGFGRVVHLLLTPDSLRWAMMQVNTKKGDQIRRYYTHLEKLFKVYHSYQCKLDHKRSTIILQAELTNKELEVQLAMQSKDNELARARKQIELIETQNQDLIKYKLFSEKKEFVYIISTLADANKGLFKVGRTIDLSSRIATYNTAHPPGDEMIYFYTWKCCSSKSLERRITEILFSFRYKKNREYYEIRYAALVSIIDLIATHEGEEEEVINAMIQEQLSAERNVDKQIEWFTPDEYPELLQIEHNESKPTKVKSKVKPLTEGDIKPVVVLVINGLSSNEIKQSDLTEKIKQGLRDVQISPNRYKVSEWKSTINEALTAHGIRVIRR